MAFRPITYVLLAGLVVLPAVALVQYWRHRLHRWRFALASSAWLIPLSNVVPSLTDSEVLAGDTGFWPAVALGAALGGMVGLGLTVWFWIRRDDRPGRAAGESV
jgi:hypothetical protein